MSVFTVCISRILFLLQIAIHRVSLSSTLTLSSLGTHPLSSPTSQSDGSIYSFQKKKLHGSEAQSISPSNSESDVEKLSTVFPPLSNSSVTIYQGRPDVASIITETVAGADKHDRMVVAVCGPGGMMLDARKSVAENIKVDGPSLELHSEHFGR